MSSGSPKRGTQRSASGNELQIFFQGIRSQLSESMTDVIANLEKDEITVEDIKHMKKQTLYKFGVSSFEDAEIILQHARRDSVFRSRSLSDNSKRSHQMKLTEISRTVCDILSESLDPSMEGLSSWEKFGELLLGKNALELQTFKRFQSPTAAILNQKMGEAPTTTLGEVLDVLNEIGRKDVVEHVTKVIQKGGRLLEQIPPPCLAQLHQSTSLDSGYEDAKTKADRAAPFQRSASLPVHAPVITTSPSNGASSELEEATRELRQPTETEILAAQLKSMTLEANQQISVTCKVYNASTNTLIQGKTPLLRDITVMPRVQQFSAECVPLDAEIRLEITTDAPCFLYVINIGTSGKTTVLLPNEYQTDNFFQGSQTYYLPGEDYGFKLEGPSGKEIIQVMAFSQKQVALSSHAGNDIQEPLLRDISIIRKKEDSELKRGFAQVEFLVK